VSASCFNSESEWVKIKFDIVDLHSSLTGTFHYALYRSKRFIVKNIGRPQ